MSRFSRLSPIVLMMLGGVFAAGSVAVGQGVPAPAGVRAPARAPAAAAVPARTGATAQAAAPKAQAGAPEAQSGPETATPEPNAENDAIESFPVMAISSVEILRSEHTPAVDVILVRGLTSADGWTAGTLVPISRGTPIDGVLDLVFVAQAPQDSAATTGFAPIYAMLPLDAGHPYTAIRVRGASNTVMLKTLPGYVEAKSPSEACNPCVGKQFVAKGAAAPAGTPASEVVQEEKLPAHVRVLRPADGVDDMRPNPNRLTLVIGEDGRIVDAVWE
jgi:hypothetical protein